MAGKHGGKKIVFCMLGCVLLLGRVSAQEGNEPGTEEEVPITSDWSGVMPSRYTRGDQTLNISLGALFPMLFVGNAGVLDNHVYPGGTFSLAYNYFLSADLYIGGEFNIMAAGTLGKNMLYLFPFGLRVGYQAVISRFEFPFTLMIGAAPQKYLDEDYFGFFMKGMVSGFFRFNPNWSFGVNAGWWWVPQWGTAESSVQDVQGHFLETTLAARYHF
ncbi:MAG: hypothetical protein LBQ30_08080 [Treponema sp.]|jgi:hypothetical protein|nr:hypothetical protein [Treponema sp.]